MLQQKKKNMYKTYHVVFGILYEQAITHTDNTEPIKLGEDYIDQIHDAPLKYKNLQPLIERKKSSCIMRKQNMRV